MSTPNTKRYFSQRCRCGHYKKGGQNDVHTCSQICGRTCSTSRKETFPCYICDKIFMTRSGLVHHLRIIHEIGGKRFTECEICGKSVKHYKLHMRVHIGPKQQPVVCDICGQTLSTVQSHFRHYKTLHSGKEPYLCELCGKSFRYYEAFKIHERIHIDFKRHICHVCGKGFLESSYLTKHLRCHKNKWAFLSDWLSRQILILDLSNTSQSSHVCHYCIYYKNVTPIDLQLKNTTTFWCLYFFPFNIIRFLKYRSVLVNIILQELLVKFSTVR